MKPGFTNLFCGVKSFQRTADHIANRNDSNRSASTKPSSSARRCETGEAAVPTRPSEPDVSESGREVFAIANACPHKGAALYDRYIDDPKFRYWGAVWSVLGNLLGNVGFFRGNPLRIVV